MLKLTSCREAGMGVLPTRRLKGTTQDGLNILGLETPWQRLIFTSGESLWCVCAPKITHL